MSLLPGVDLLDPVYRAYYHMGTLAGLKFSQALTAAELPSGTTHLSFIKSTGEIWPSITNSVIISLMFAHLW